MDTSNGRALAVAVVVIAGLAIVVQVEAGVPGGAGGKAGVTQTQEFSLYTDDEIADPNRYGYSHITTGEFGEEGSSARTITIHAAGTDGQDGADGEGSLPGIGGYKGEHRFAVFIQVGDDQHLQIKNGGGESHPGHGGHAGHSPLPAPGPAPAPPGSQPLPGQPGSGGGQGGRGNPPDPEPEAPPGSGGGGGGGAAAPGGSTGICGQATTPGSASAAVYALQLLDGGMGGDGGNGTPAGDGGGGGDGAEGGPVFVMGGWGALVIGEGGPGGKGGVGGKPGLGGGGLYGKNGAGRTGGEVTLVAPDWLHPDSYARNGKDNSSGP